MDKLDKLEKTALGLFGGFLILFVGYGLYKNHQDKKAVTK